MFSQAISFDGRKEKLQLEAQCLKLSTAYKSKLNTTGCRSPHSPRRPRRQDIARVYNHFPGEGFSPRATPFTSSTCFLPKTQARQWPVSQPSPTLVDADGLDEFQRG